MNEKKHYLRDSYLIESATNDYQEQASAQQDKLQAVCYRLAELLDIEWTAANIATLTEQEFTDRLYETIETYKKKLPFAASFNEALEADYKKTIQEVSGLFAQLDSVRKWCRKNSIAFKVSSKNIPYLHDKDVEQWIKESASVKFTEQDKELFDIVGCIADEMQRLHKWLKQNPTYSMHDLSLIENLQDGKLDEDGIFRSKGYSISTEKFAGMKRSGFLHGMLSLRQQMAMGLVRPMI